MPLTIRTPEIEQQVLDRLSAGEALNAICDETFPVAESTVRKWAIEDADGFGAKYARARDIGLDCRADAMLKRAREASDAGLGRLSFDADRWYLSKMAPKRFGDKTLIGSDPENPLPSQALDLTGISTAALKELAKLAPNG